MWLIVDQSLGAGFSRGPSLPFQPGVLERKVNNNDDITFFSILTFAKLSCDNVLQPSLLCCSGCNAYRTWLGNRLYTEKNVLSS